MVSMTAVVLKFYSAVQLDDTTCPGHKFSQESLSRITERLTKRASKT